MTTQRFDAAAATWDEEPRRLRLAEDVATAIRAACGLPDDVDVLDFGCGTGLLSLALRPLVRSVTGVDASAGMLDVLARKVRERAVAGVDVALLAPGGMRDLGARFDLVVSSMALHHVEDLESLLADLRSVLRPGGRVALADLETEDGSFHEDPAGVFHRGFARDDVLRLFAAAGFIDVAVTTATVTRKSGRDYGVFLATGGAGG